MENGPPHFEAVLLSVESLASRTDDPGLALREILAAAAGLFRADSAFAAVLDPDSGKLKVEAALGLPPEEGLELALGQGIPGWAAWHGKGALAPDTAADPRYRALRPGVGCQMAAPMSADGEQVLGVIALDREAPGAYAEEDLVRLERLADAAGRAMSRLWQLRHLQGKARQLEALVTTGRSLVSKLEPHELFDTLAREARHMMQCRACALYLHDAAAGAVRLAAFAGPGVPAIPPGDLPLDSCLVAAPIHTRRAVAFADIRSPEFRGLADLPVDGLLRSVLATPLAYEGEVLGVLAVFTDRVHRFDNDEKRLCAALAGLGAVALQNARLYARVFRGEETLRKNERLTTLGLLAAEIAHEIRNPLTVLKLLVGGLGVDFPPEDPRRTDMRVIGEKLDQLEAIVTRVLTFAKAPASLHARCSLAEIVGDTLALLRLKLAQSKIQVRFAPPERPLLVDGHKGQLQQVLLNLLINSMQAMPEGGEIAITLRGEPDGAGTGGSAVLEVADTGAGIPEEIRGRVFDSFLSGRPDGTGLGLAIAKRVLLGHRGDIALVSTSPAGTTLRVTLPLAKA